MDQHTETNTQHIYRVSELNHEVKQLLEQNYFAILLEGEVSNFIQHRSGHWYFSLKDEQAQIQCAMFRLQNSKANFIPENGDHILVQAKVSLYPDRGNYQLIVQRLEAVGAGLLQKRFEQLKQQLQQQGLFDPAHKKPLPKLPNTIGVISSTTGAALQDILTVLKRRYPIAAIRVYHCLVQGEQAPDTIIQALQLANQEQYCDVLILARGGGSMEDLWAFNNETLARAVFASELPIITGIGHEIDFTICDFVADIRAATPSAAAETVAPDQQELLRLLLNYQQHISQLITSKIQHWQNQLNYYQKRLQVQDPRQVINKQQEKISNLHKQLLLVINKQQQQKQQIIAKLAGQLHALSPLAILQRGYAIVTHQNQVLDNIRDIQVDMQVETQLANGKFIAQVTDITTD